MKVPIERAIVRAVAGLTSWTAVFDRLGHDMTGWFCQYSVRIETDAFVKMPPGGRRVSKLWRR